MLRIIFCASALLCACSSLFISQSLAAVYKWVDEDGQIHFSDKPPAQRESESVTIKATPSTDAASLEQRRKTQQETLESLTQARKEREQKSAEKAAAKQKRKQDCDKLAARIAHSERINRYYRYGDDGEIIYLSDEQGDALRQRLKSQYQANCS
ncbi:MAG: DUF4124 domain-containing protein [Pseudomonadota bacterium]